MKEVNVDLYEFLQDRETGLYKDSKTNEVITYVHIPFYDLPEFVEIVGSEYFSEGGIDVVMLYDTICIDLNIIIENEGHELESYKGCFNKNDWEDYFGKEN